MTDTIFTQTLWNNTPAEYITALALAVFAYTFINFTGNILFSVLIKKSRKHEWKWDSYFLEKLQRLVLPFLYITGIYFSITRLTLPEIFENTLFVSLVLILAFYAIRFISLIIHMEIYFHTDKQDGRTAPLTFYGLKTILNVILWVLAIIFIMDNLGFKISAVIAGIGIGGIAIALAAQAVLGDLFAYFAILMDHPFKVGDFIKVDQQMGTIEQIGIKTTRVRSLSGELLVFPNKDLTDSRIHNYFKMSERRVLFTISVTYQTPLKKLKEIPVMIKKFIEEEEDVRFDRAHFKEYTDSGLNFEIVYWVLSPDFAFYMTKQESINLKIYSYFEKKKISFAYPTRTIYMHK